MVTFKIQRWSKEKKYIYIYEHRRTRSKVWVRHDKHEDEKKQ